MTNIQEPILNELNQGKCFVCVHYRVAQVRERLEINDEAVSVCVRPRRECCFEVDLNE